MSFKETNSLPSISCLCSKAYEGSPHFIQLQTAEGDETAKQYEVKSAHDANFLRENITSILPSVSEPTLHALIARLVDDIGVETREDLIHVREADFSGVLKPIQARKLIHAWKEGSYTCVTQCSSLDPLGGSVESYRLVPVTEGTDLTQINVNPPNTTTFSAISQRRQPDNSISVPYIVTVGSSEVSLLDTSVSSQPAAHPHPPPITPTQPDTTREKYILPDKNWASAYTIPQNKIKPKIKECLSRTTPIRIKLMREFIRVISDDIYLINKRPSPHDLHIIAKLLTDTYPALQNSSGDCIESVFFRLRNRINFRRKKEASEARALGITLNWVENFTIPWHKMSLKIRTALASSAQLEPHMKREIVRVVADEIMLHTNEPKAKQLRSVTQQMIATYSDSLSDRVDGQPTGKCEWLYKTMDFRIHYLIKKLRKSQYEEAEVKTTQYVETEKQTSHYLEPEIKSESEISL